MVFQVITFLHSTFQYKNLTDRFGFNPLGTRFNQVNLVHKLCSRRDESMVSFKTVVCPLIKANSSKF